MDKFDVTVTLVFKNIEADRGQTVLEEPGLSIALRPD